MAGLQDFQDALAKLTDLFSAGLIDDDYYNDRKAALVDGYVAGPQTAPPGTGRMKGGGRRRPPTGPRYGGPSNTWGIPGCGDSYSGGFRGAMRCHNCGATDHLVRQCPHPEACHSCKGTDHKMGQCPYAPQGLGLGGLRCHNCGAADHLVRNCPHPEACHNCKGTDHKVGQCPYGQQGMGMGMGGMHGRSIRCHNCGAPDHMVRDCPHPEVCHNCKGTDHKVSHCPLPQACHVCGSTDHKLRECPQRHRRPYRG